MKNNLANVSAQRLVVTLLSVIFLISLISAADYLPHKLNEEFNLTISSNNATDCNLSYIQYPNGATTVQNLALAQSVTSFYMSIDAGNYTDDGITCHGVTCTDGVSSQTGSVCREVTSTGTTLTEGRSTIYIGLIAIIVFLFIAIFVGIGYLPNSNTSSEDGGLIGISYLKYFRSTLWFVEWMLLVAIFFLSSNLAYAYLGETLFADFLFAFFYITMALTPIILIIWLISFFVMIWKDRELKKLLSRGFMGGDI